ncbi:MAG: hypothetical protein HY287_08385 [Planctomycetes bacterium]|nr:hypothetical protein [Planctomycetota bacterium]MBI3834330.1 hypothetical protein [Planctomycetota bacterium]
MAALVAVPTFGALPGKVKDGTRAERLVTGDTTRIANVVAATGTMKLYFTPVPPLPGTDPSLAYPAGFSIANQVLTVSAGGFTSAWNVQMSDWDPDRDGNPLVRSFQAKVDASGFMGANASPPNPGCDLAYPAETFACPSQCFGGTHAGQTCSNSLLDCNNTPCTFKHCSGGTSNGNLCVSSAQCPGGTCSDPCPALLGESGARCGGSFAGVCDWGWQNTARPDWIMAANSPSDQIPAAAISSPTGPNFAGTTSPGVEIFDPGVRAYIGTLLLPVPACARGTYTIGFIADETFAQDEAQPANNIPVGEFVAGQLVIPVSIGITASVPPVCTIDARFPNDPNNVSTRFGFNSIVLTFSSDPGALAAANFQITAVPSGPGVPVISNVQKNGNQATITFDRVIPSTRWTCVKHLQGEQDTACIGALGADTDASRLSDTPDALALIDALDGNPVLQIWQTDLDRSGVFTPIDILASIDLLNGAGALSTFRGLTLQACPTVGIP